MTDLVKEVDIVSLPLRFAMIADRAEVALTKIERGMPLDDRDRTALKNARDFLGEADEGEKILGSNTMKGYSPTAISAYELSEDASRKAKITQQDFRSGFQAKLTSLLAQPDPEESALGALGSLAKFFHELAEWCLAQDVGEIEGLDLGSRAYVQG